MYIVNTDTGAVVLEKIFNSESYAIASDDGTRAYFLARDYYADSRTIEIYDTATGERVGEPITADAYNYGLSFTDDGKRMYIESPLDDDHDTVRIYDAKTVVAIGDSFTLDGGMYDLLSSSDGRFDIIRNVTYEEGTSFDGGTSTVTIVDTAAGAPIDSFTFQAGYGEIKLIEKGDRTYVVGLSTEGYYQNVWATTVAVIDADTGVVLGEPVQLDGEGNIYFSEDGWQPPVRDHCYARLRFELPIPFRCNRHRNRFACKRSRGHDRYRIWPSRDQCSRWQAHPDPSDDQLSRDAGPVDR
jgi:DNA-binding beta-propeller fold protein YncE